MNIYKSKGAPEKYKITDKLLEYENWEKDWERKGDLPRRVSIFRNSTNIDITRKEIEEHLYLTEELLEDIIKDIKRIRSKI